MNEQVAELRRAWWERTGCVAAVVIALVILVVLAFVAYRIVDQASQAAGRSKGSDNLRSLGHLVRSDGYRALRSNLTGKAFVLGLLVADDPNWDNRSYPANCLRSTMCRTATNLSTCCADIAHSHCSHSRPRPIWAH